MIEAFNRGLLVLGSALIAVMVFSGLCFLVSAWAGDWRAKR